MGIGYDELLNMTWREYDYYTIGHLRRIERDFDVARFIVANLFNSSGFSKRKVSPKDIMQLPLLDGKQKTFVRMSDERYKKLKKYLN